jgi:hypothetical protein
MDWHRLHLPEFRVSSQLLLSRSGHGVEKKLKTTDLAAKSGSVHVLEAMM